ncbi:MAG: M20/M25/M40 family metallo-hydrolase [Gemmatimonadales bacterium]
MTVVRSLILFSIVSPCAASLLVAQDRITGFAAAHVAPELRLEAQLRAVPDTASARRHARVLAGAPHVAGTPAQRATADYVLQQMQRWGLDTARVPFRVYLPYHDSTIVERVTPKRVRLNLDEPPVQGDPTTAQRRWVAMNGNSGSGDVTAPLVYVNYGLPSDYATLDSMGVQLAGRIAIARYGRSFRGIKAREAELHGASALIIYSDPLDDGFAQGDVYPAGPMRPPQGVQRGSIFNGQGDPTTPGWASTADARRLPVDSLAVPKIPVVPMSYGNAEQLLGGLDGASVPSGWQGGLPFRYHVGNGAVRVRVAVFPERGDRAFKTIYNTMGTIRGSEFPEELVIVGGHRDAWGPGAADNVSGVVTILEAARAWGAALSSGERPRRTLVFATWDAEEWGLVGSTEWTELMRDALNAQAVAYLNVDVSAAGRLFGSSGTASLQDLMREVTKTVQQPGDSVSVYRDWERRTVTSQRLVPPMGDLGGGSDFGPFYNGLGIPSFDFGFGGQGGVYHSAYDTWSWMEKFGDPGYLSHAAAGRLAAVLLARLANADVVALDYHALGSYIGELTARIGRDTTTIAIKSELDDLSAAAADLAKAGKKFSETRDAKLAADDVLPLGQVNAALRSVERQLVRPSGLVGRPGLRNLIFAADRDNGYANVALPGIAEALRDRDIERARSETKDLTQRIEAATRAVQSATSSARGS